AFVPQPQHIMGAAMVKIPGAGTVFSFLQKPLVLGGAAGTLVTVLVAGGAMVIARRRRRAGLPAFRRRGERREVVPAPQMAVQLAPAAPRRASAQSTVVSS